MKIVFFGTGRYVIPVLEVLHKDFEIPLVLTTEKSDNEPVSKFCKENSIECLSVSVFDKMVNDKLSMVNAPVAVLANFGLILPQTLLDIFPKGIINVHPSLLPAFRGPTPGQNALLAGDLKTGVSIIRLDDEIDHGPILIQKEAEILPFDTAETLYVRLFNVGAQILQDCLRRYLDGDLEPTQQDHSKATFTKTLKKDSGLIDLNGQPASQQGGSSIVNAQLPRMVRAYFPWPGVWFKANLNGTDLPAGKAGKIIKLLPEKKIQVEGKKEMSYKDFINGYPGIGKQILTKLGLL